MLHLILFFVLLSVVLVLVVVAWRLWRKVLERKKGLEQENTERLKNILERTGYIHESLNVIALSLLEGQVRVAEAGIRMAVLLSNLSLDCEEKNRFSAVFEIHEKSSHIPTHDKWKSLGRWQQRAYEQQLQEIEDEYDEAIREVAGYIRNNPFKMVLEEP